MATIVVDKYGGLPPLELYMVLLAQDMSSTVLSRVEEVFANDGVLVDKCWWRMLDGSTCCITSTGVLLPLELMLTGGRTAMSPTLT